jgi:ATP-binding cassette subfamily B protein
MNYRLGRQNTSTANQMSTVIQESLGAAKLILGFGNQLRSQAALEGAFDGHREATVKSQTLALATTFGYEPLGLVVVVGALFLAQYFQVAVSEMAVLLWALRNTMPSVAEVAKQRNSLSNFFPSYEQIKRLNDDALKMQQPVGSRRFTGIGIGIVLENVSFAYPDQTPALRNVSVRVESGTMVAFVGSSGSGKSTLIDLIMGFLEPQSGRLTIDGAPIEKYDLQSYRSRIGYVPQDAPLFNATIRENLLWSKPDATDSDVETACDQAHATEFILDLPNGYDTMVGDRGVRLSGGQAQRIALARAILRKPDLLVMDEATSSLDTESERLIQRAIESIARETTILVIAHRLSTVVQADRIFVIDQGRVVEEGRYQELVDAGGRFERMARLQVLEPGEVAQ